MKGTSWGVGGEKRKEIDRNSINQKKPKELFLRACQKIGVGTQKILQGKNSAMKGLTNRQ